MPLPLLLDAAAPRPALPRVGAAAPSASNELVRCALSGQNPQLTSLMHSQLFGLFDEGFADPLVALSRVVNMLTAPPPQANSEGEIAESQRSGSMLLFYWSTLSIRLCFGSFIVAILVGALNKVRSVARQQEVLLPIA